MLLNLNCKFSSSESRIYKIELAKVAFFIRCTANFHLTYAIQESGKQEMKGNVRTEVGWELGEVGWKIGREVGSNWEKLWGYGKEKWG